MGVFDHRKPAETGKSGKITFPDTRTRTIIVEPGEYGATETFGLRTTPQGTIDRFQADIGIKVVRDASEFSVHSILAPENPTDVGATATGSATIDIAGTVNNAGNDGVEIHMSTTQGGPYSLEDTVEESAFPVEIAGLTGDTTYYFVLRSFIWDGEQKFAAFTAEVSAHTGAGGSAPSAPTQPQIAEINRTATTMTLEATWTDVADETSYEWSAGSDDGTTWSDSATGLAADSTSVQFVATRTNADHTGFFCVKACNASGCSVNSCNGLTVVGNLTAPSSLSATNPSGSDVDLDWTDMAGASIADVTAIERRLVGGTFTEIDTVVFGTTHYDDNALADGDYEYRVRHRDTDTGNVSPYSVIDSVGINSGGGGSAYPNEPAGLTAFGRIDFTNGITAQVGEARDHSHSGHLTFLTDDTTAPSGDNSVARQEFWDGETDGGSGGRRFDLWGPAIDEGGGSNQYSEIYISFWLKVEGTDFENQSVGTKVFYVAYGVADRHNDSYFMLDGTGSQSIQSSMRLRARLSENTPDDTPGLSITPNIDGNKKVNVGEWTQIEVRMKINDPDVANGELDLWVGGTLTTSITNWIYRSSTNNRAFYHLQATPVWGGNSGDTRTRDDFWRIDEVYISGA